MDIPGAECGRPHSVPRCDIFFLPFPFAAWKPHLILESVVNPKRVKKQNRQIAPKVWKRHDYLSSLQKHKKLVIEGALPFLWIRRRESAKNIAREKEDRKIESVTLPKPLERRAYAVLWIHFYHSFVCKKNNVNSDSPEWKYYHLHLSLLVWLVSWFFASYFSQQVASPAEFIDSAAP